MNCHKCGASNREDARFCTTCGSELLIPTKEEQQQAQDDRAKEQKDAVKSFIIGVCTCAFSIFIGIFLLPLSIIGIRYGIKSKNDIFGKVGIVLNIMNIFIQIISTFLVMPFMISVFKDLLDSDRYANKYICSDIEAVEVEDNIIFQLNKDKKFTLSYEYPDSNGVISGTYKINSYEVNTVKDVTEYTYEIKLNADSRVIDNELVDGDYQTKYSLKIKGEEVLLENTISNNKYTCKKAN